ncbi:hypothetical protein FB45DRAFT_6723 [Roridomyces roridus]|uniref:Arrestin-like N-terminal domain-containing protein n=1 Tax=Roridomyces roridus TaxID=1738132 RepID=A0AAD7FYG9_9AGAR|nr:hypothetical protein FB45DRAFT_6723 [Roridomyces roridus]
MSSSAFLLSPSVASLPAYTARPARRPSTAGGAPRTLTEHVFEIKKDKLLAGKEKKAWATLTLRSSARSASSLPTFLEGDKLTGEVTLDVSGSEGILGVSIAVRGQIVTGPQQHLCFLDMSTPLWLKGMPAAGNGKLSGDHHWPFSISLPGEVTLPCPAASPSWHRHHPETAPKKTYRLPQTFLERTSIATVYYELFVHISRSTFRVDNKLQTMFIYVPALRPEPPSRPRQLAYRQNTPVPGPDMDPEGWHTMRAVEIAGTVFGARHVKIEAMLSLAKPLSYTRGSVIPCSLTYLCSDTQALNLICTPLTNHVCLHRQTTYIQAPAVAEHSHHVHSFATADSVIGISRAVWWPVRLAEDAGDERKRRRFDGEIHLPKSLKPSSRVSHFSISYFVVMLPFQVTGFMPEDNSRPHLRQEVQIATMFSKGPKPRAYTPPSYEISEVGADNTFFIPPS